LKKGGIADAVWIGDVVHSQGRNYFGYLIISLFEIDSVVNLEVLI
jgi:hypothetical protein